ncbi:PAS domain S-box-containing protein [Mariprofundus aestuarium]|uniref:histidine kinase n=1 Tax=Mariprofundus aestuarium TaxID=1921086 RepID=A0A2K8L5W2_MARES|nr:PAS domain S-box protein [Mariprofundus aestuarium]ATX80364.1 PAS domain S-box-containing protein [Mariprofundus aestuarium]
MSDSPVAAQESNAFSTRHWGVTSYFLATFLPVALLITAAAYSIYTIEKKSRIDLLIEQNQSMIKLQKEVIAQDFRLIISDILFLASETELQEGVNDSDNEQVLDATLELQSFVQAKKIYDQIRLIDNNGMERIRINFDGTNATVVPQEKLQSKADRYYFREALKLKKGEVYISPLDLNIELGEIEVPHKPMIRFATPLMNSEGRRLGVIIANYLGQQMLDHFINIHAEKPELSHLLNRDGYWLHSNPHGLEWGFMFEGKKEVRFQSNHGEAWQQLALKQSGYLKLDKGIYCFTSLNPLQKIMPHYDISNSLALGEWKIVAFNSAADLDLILAETRSKMLFWSLLSLPFIALIFWFLARAIVSKRVAEASARMAEARMHEAVRIALDSVITIDHQGLIIEFNKMAEQTFGYSEAEILGQSIADTIIPLLHREEHLRGMEKHLPGDQAPMLGKRLETLALHKNGHEIPIELSITPVKTGESTVFTAFIRDLSERKQSEEKIHKLSQAIEQAGESIIITDLEGSIEYVNPAFCSITGYKQEEVVGKNPRILNSGQQNLRFYQEMWKTIKNGETWQGRIIDKRKDGSQFPAILTISPITCESGEITHFIGLQQNLQEYEALEERFHQAQKMEALGTLVGGIAHDFNNTLAGITGNLYLIKKQLADRPEILKKLNIVETLSFQASEMIRQLMAFSRRSVINMEQLYLPSFLKETSKIHKVSIPENIHLSYIISNESMYIQADVNQLQQMMLNLINNARDALEGVEKPAISIELKRFTADPSFLDHHPGTDAVDFAQISVSDNGHGIAQEDIDHIFEPFFTTKEVGKGTGLGLSMVYGCVHSHKGFIEASSNKPNGTRFDIYIPLLEPEVGAQHLLGEQSILVETGDGETVLLVDDDLSLISTVSEILEGLNYNVLTASNGQEAVETFMIHHHAIKLLILDVVMPIMGGYDALLEMRKINPAIKCIFTTGYDKMKVLQSQDMSDKETVLAKPYEVSELSRLIHDRLK